MPDPKSPEPFDPGSTTRPVPALLSYYLIVSLLTVIFFPFVFLPMLFKYNTLRYQFDDEGVSMAWGVLFRRETYLTYRRIQDIHVSRGFIQRWLGLATVSVQTASGSSGAEMAIEGIGDPQGLRDYLYSKMRGSQEASDEAAASAGAEATGVADPAVEVLVLLREIRDQVRALREARGPGEVRDA